MNIEQILNALRQGLQGTRLQAFTPYSDTYILLRAVAAVLSERESSLTNLIETFYIATSSGSYLDRRAKDFNLYRVTGTASKGTLLVLSDVLDVLLPYGLILRSADGLMEYQLSRQVQCPKGVEVLVPVESINLSAEANLPAGTILTTNFYPHVRFLVGRYRDPLLNQPKGDLVGGSGLESDYQFRLRVLQYLQQGSPTSKTALLGLLRQVDGLGDTVLVEHDPIPGYLTCYLGTTDSTRANQARLILDRNKAAGISIRTQPIVYKTVDIAIAVSFYGRTPLLPDVIRNQVDRYVKGLSIGQPLLLGNLRQALIDLGSDGVGIIKPTVDVSVGMGEMIRPGSIEVNVRSQ